MDIIFLCFLAIDVLMLSIYNFKVKILCHLHHDQLRAVFHVSQRIRKAVSLCLSASNVPQLLEVDYVCF